MDVTLILCDSAQAVGGKLYVLGGGWTNLVVSPASRVAMALGVVIAVPWDQTNRPHELVASLRDDDGHVVQMGGRPVQSGGNMEVGRPPGIKPGSSINAVMALAFQGLELEPGGYVWTLSVGDTEVQKPFRVSSISTT